MDYEPRIPHFLSRHVRRKDRQHLGAAVLLLAVAASATAQSATTPHATDIPALSGALPKTIKAEGGPYLVATDISVPSGKTVTIEAGAVLLFRNFTGLHVEGQLVVNGTGTRPVVFTSEFDHDHNPSSSMQANPYDWNGVFIHEGGIGSTLKHCRILYSVYGINAATKFIRIEQGVFLQNGRANLTVEGEQHPVTERPYTYALSVSDATVDGVPVKILMDPQARKRNVFRYSGLGAFVGGGSLAMWFGSLVSDGSRRLRELSDSSVPDSWEHNLVQNDSRDYESAKTRRVRDVVLMTTALGIGVLGTTGFVWSFTF